MTLLWEGLPLGLQIGVIATSLILSAGAGALLYLTITKTR